ncbi:ribose 5-phosphate isomerase A-domain-containing protein [Camillea tinctor]|nr:ribose 5-phosphate isomerase A-domain-containing protein [Camillea tinctor]
MNPQTQFLAACAYTTTTIRTITTTRTTAAAICNVLKSNRRPPAVFTSYPVSARRGVTGEKQTLTSGRRSFVSITTPYLLHSNYHHYHQQQQQQKRHQHNYPTRPPSPTNTHPPHHRPIMTTDLIESAKRAACQRAVAEHFDPSFRYIGIGSGSTVAYVVEAIAAQGPSVTSGMQFIPSGSGSAALVRGAGLSVLSIPELLALASGSPSSFPGVTNRQYIDVYFDGADEVDAQLAAIKGGGACLFQEKVVARLSKKFVCVADSRKRAPRLLASWPAVPVEVAPVAADLVRLALVDLGARNPVVRTKGPGAAPAGTDNGNWIIDAPFAPLLTAGEEGEAEKGKWTPESLAAAIKGILGVLEVGIFAGPTGPQAKALGPDAAGVRPVKAYFGNADGDVETLG